MALLEIEKRFTVVAKIPGTYAAFPTLVRDGDVIWIALRRGLTAANTPHGDQGQVLLFFANIDRLDHWQKVPVIFNQTPAQPNNLDAILSGPFGDDFFLCSRHYRHDSDNMPYLSRISREQLQQAVNGRRPLIIDRQALNSIFSTASQSEFVAASYGHLSEHCDELLMTTYSTVENYAMHNPVVLSSTDRGNSWQKKSVICYSSDFGEYLNENTIVALDDGRWLAAIRTGAEGFPLYYAISTDDSMSHWSTPQRTGMVGHSPVLLRSHKGGPLLFYRDLSQDKPMVSIASYTEGTWRRLGVLFEYKHIYNGGYTDAVHLDNDRYLVVTYLDDEDASPWVEALVCRINLQESGND